MRGLGMRLIVMVVACWAVAVPASWAAAGDGPGVLDGAPERIEQCRKGDFALVLNDAGGRPLRGAEVEVELTRHEFLFGCNIFMWSDGRDEFSGRYRDRYEALLNYATLPFYWWAYEPEPGKTDEARARRIAAWCAERGIALKGHPLVWNHADPVWLPDDETKVRALTFGRVDALVKAFAGTVDVWDVVNEPTDWERNEKQAPRTTKALMAPGKIEAVKDALRRARAANPKATLLVNDYVTSDEFYAVLDELRDDEGTPLFDAIGLQTHMHGGPRPLEDIWAVCERFAKLGGPLHFTEVTVLSEYPDKKLGEKETARYVADLYTLLFSHPAVEAITWWDFSDRGAWLDAKAGLLRADGTPKPACEELMKLVHTTWTTKLVLRAGDDGAVRFRGFFGTYEVRVRRGPNVWATSRVTFKRHDKTTHAQQVAVK
ncbi:MAG: endo-1,4-beta-xylanase [Verrucomicrobia bacterium]|nr:endo-1,4-beta-xylanase [Verrucomicrobiota bacterium]